MRDKILFITAFTPSNVGAAVKNTKIMLKDLSSSYYVDLVYFKYNSDLEYVPDNSNIRILKQVPITSLKKMVSCLSVPYMYPLFTVRFNWGVLWELKKTIEKEDYKVIVCDHSQVMLYARFLNTSIPKYLICHDVISQRVSRSSNSLISWFAKKTEKYILNKNSRVFSFSQKDCNLISELFNIKANLCLDYIDELAEEATPNNIDDYFVFFAYWGRPDNYEGIKWFYSNVVPKIKVQTNFVIIGKGLNPDYVRHDNPLVNTKILGFVDNPYDLIANAKAVISPLFSGAGIKVKVIEALACGTPVLGTDIAFEGFDSKYNSFMLLCNTPLDYIDYMNRVDCDVDKRRVFKIQFLNSYKSKTMLNYIDEID